MFRVNTYFVGLSILLISLFLLVQTSIVASAQSDFDCNSVTEIPVIECESLVVIYGSLDSGQTSSTNPYPLAWDELPTPCEWDGITCTDGVVTAITLHGRGLVGDVPAAIGNLTSLTFIDLGGNQLTSLPDEIGQLSNLVKLYISDTPLDSWPLAITNLTQLEEMRILDTCRPNGAIFEAWLATIPTILTSEKILYCDSLFDCSEVTEIPITECEALVTFYDALQGPGWIYNLGTAEGVAWTTNNAVCTWHGITCADGRVTELNMTTGASIPIDGQWIAGLNGIIPADISALTELRVLDVSNSDVNGVIPADISALTELRVLDVSNSDVGDAPPEIGQLTNLERLDMSYTDAGPPPPEIGNLINLKELNLDNSTVRQIPSTFGNLINLERLDLSQTRISTIPPELGNLTNLVTLDLGSNQITEVPPEIGNLTNLNILRLQSNLIKTLPPEIGNLTNLTHLFIQRGSLETLPAEISNLTNLIRLDIDHSPNLNFTEIVAPLNALGVGFDLSFSLQDDETLPPELIDLTSLMTLTVSIHRDNTVAYPSLEALDQVQSVNATLFDMPTWPSRLANVTNLTELTIHTSLLTEFPPEIGDLSNLTELTIYNNNDLITLPPEIGNLTNLITLNIISNNVLESIPAEIGNLTALTTLRLSQSKPLQAIPDSIGNLTNLTWLSVTDNPELTIIPDEINNLTNLTRLDLDNNLISRLPDIGNLTALTRLNVSQNPLLIWPDTLTDLIGIKSFYMQGLCEPNQTVLDWINRIPVVVSHDSPELCTVLNVSDAQLTTLPAEIGERTHLTDLFLNDNFLTELPAEMGNLVNLERLSLSGNNLTTLPQSVCDLPNLNDRPQQCPDVPLSVDIVQTELDTTGNVTIVVLIVIASLYVAVIFYRNMTNRG